MWPMGFSKARLAPSEHPNPTTKIGSKMGGAPIPPMVSLALTHSHVNVFVGQGPPGKRSPFRLHVSPVGEVQVGMMVLRFCYDARLRWVQNKRYMSLCFLPFWGNQRAKPNHWTYGDLDPSKKGNDVHYGQDASF